MKELTIQANVCTLINALQENLKRHKKDYKIAREIYFDDLCQILNEMIDDAEEKVEREDRYLVSLVAPRDESEQYKRHIGFLELSEEKEIEISMEDYQRIVEDDWDWIIQANRVNATYSSRI